MRKWKRRRGRKRGRKRRKEVGRRDKEHISCFLIQRGWLAN